MLRHLRKEELAQYRRPFADAGEARRPMLTWARQLLFDGEPTDVTETASAYGAWLADNPIPKCFIPSDPGMMPPSVLTVCRAWPMQREFTARAHLPPGGRSR